MTSNSLFRTYIDGTPEGDAALDRLLARGESDFARVEADVRAILAAVRERGDEAVLAFAERFDKRRPSPLVRRDYPGAAALARLPAPARAALEIAAARVRAFHERQREHEAKTFRFTDADGCELGTRVLPIARAGVYAPGGKARYPSSVLMSAIPAQVAGVREILLATPLAGDASDDALYAAAHLSGVTAILDAGGAHAIGALAYGTESVPRVDKIVGPGNLYVACAKRLVFGAVAIDGVAGPSEILVVADDTADARVVAADLLSQAEHDEAAYPLLVCASVSFAEAVSRELALALSTLPRAAIARASVEANGLALVASSRARLAELADAIAAEHVSLQVSSPETMLEGIRSAGAIFLGPATPEAAGDYLAGPSHVLPTGGSVRFGSPLGVYDFVTRSSTLRYSEAALARQADAITAFARLEGLEGHARAVEVRTRHRSPPPGLPPNRG
ncbi:MAG: histidinol dehydrogenase, partial [Polyangiaceae bacterium]